MKYKFNCSYGCSDQDVYEDISSIISLTGYESQAEMERMHQDLFHWHDEYEEDELFDRQYNRRSPTTKSLSIDAKETRRQHQRCSICPPNKGENASRKAKHGNQKPRYKNHRRK